MMVKIERNYDTKWWQNKDEIRWNDMKWWHEIIARMMVIIVRMRVKWKQNDDDDKMEVNEWNEKDKMKVNKC